VIVGSVLSDCPGQARSAKGLSTIGRIGAPGDSAASRTFRAYSYGVGGLGSPQPGRGGSVLSSSLTPRGGFAVRRGAAKPKASPLGAAGGPMQASKRIYKPQRSKRAPTYAPGITHALRPRTTSGIGAADAYMATFGSTSQTALETTDEVITSLVPSEPSQYATYLEEGEKAFKEGRFEQAYRQFKLANHITVKDPESLLSLAHAAFAKSSYGYSEAGLYLRRSLIRFPELPLVQIKPRAFYGKTPRGVNRYTTRIVRLEDHIARSSYDVNALLILAYFKWFDGEYELAHKTLRRASDLLEESKDREMIEAVGIFLDGIAASGMVPTEESPAPAVKKEPESPAQDAPGS